MFKKGDILVDGKYEFEYVEETNIDFLVKVKPLKGFKEKDKNTVFVWTKVTLKLKEQKTQNHPLTSIFKQ